MWWRCVVLRSSRWTSYVRSRLFLPIPSNHSRDHSEHLPPCSADQLAKPLWKLTARPAAQGPWQSSTCRTAQEDHIITGAPLLRGAAAAALRASGGGGGLTLQGRSSSSSSSRGCLALFGETGVLDNTAITRTQQRLYCAIRAINAIQPPPQVGTPVRRRAAAPVPCALHPGVAGHHAAPPFSCLPPAHSWRCLAAMWCTRGCATWRSWGSMPPAWPRWRRSPQTASKSRRRYWGSCACRGCMSGEGGEVMGGGGSASLPRRSCATEGQQAGTQAAPAGAQGQP